MIRKGSYILIFDMPEMRTEVGALGIVDIPEGKYCYVGSAMNGLDQRIGRHLSENKKIRWHIDYLLKGCRSIDAYEAAAGITECDIGKIVEENGGTGVLKGFGCSDCRCRTHLFFLDRMVEERVRSDASLTPYAGPRLRV